MKKRSMTAFAAILVLVLLSIGAFKYIEIRGRFDITVTASFYGRNKSGQIISSNARPAETAQVANGNWAEDFAPVSFRNGVLQTGFGHGPAFIRGSISAESIRQAWPDAQEIRDWPFEIAFYNTSSGRVFHVYLDISFQTETGTASADLYMFKAGDAAAIVSHWEGELYETVSVSPKGFDI